MITQPVVLGLCAFTHDSAAALLVDGKLVGAAEEERFTSTKHTKAYPAETIAWLLDTAGVTPAEVDVVAYNFAGHRYLIGALASPRYLLPAPSRAVLRARGFAAVYRNFTRRMAHLHSCFPNARLRPVLHHRAHGLYAFTASGYPEATVLVIDSLGETQTTTYGLATRSASDAASYRIQHAIHDPHSLGYVYGAVTEHLGWRRGDEEGTVMALAARGDPGRFRDVFGDAIALTPAGFTVNRTLFPLRTLVAGASRTTAAFAARTVPPRTRDAALGDRHADLAAALQERTERTITHLARVACARSGSRRLVLAGGVAMNCVSVGKVLASGIATNLAVPPAPGDSGTAIGAALAAHLDLTGRTPSGTDRPYLGPTPDLIAGPPPDLTGLRVSTPADPVQAAAAALVAGAIIGVCRGRAELGPRALGNRSILALPTRGGVVDRLNNEIKFREPFRPFAPVVRAQDAVSYFALPAASPHMSIAVPVTDLTRRQAPAVVHANGTARVQTVTREQNPFLYDLLTAVGAATGLPMLINTSLNVKGDPMAGTTADAIGCLRATGLDAVLLHDGRWITK